jgi:hypothetical protein
MPQYEGTLRTGLTIVFTQGETADIASGLSASALAAGISPDPTLSKLFASIAGLLSIAAGFASRRGYGLGVTLSKPKFWLLPFGRGKIFIHKSGKRHTIYWV